MSPFLQVLLSLFGVALLGNIIGWCARRIVAVRDEKALMERHQREITELNKDLATERDEVNVLKQTVLRLEREASDTDRLNQTIEASEKEIQALRAESESLQQEVAAKTERVKNLEKESQLQAPKTQQLQNQTNHQAHSIDRSVTATSGATSGATAVRELNLDRYALGSVASGSADLEVDDDIADLTSDLSSVLTPDLQHELDSEPQTPTVVSGQPSGAGLFSRFNRKKKS